MGPNPALKSNEKLVPRIKPLRDIPEKEAALYAHVNKIVNSRDECPYVSGIRFEVRDFLNDMESKHTGTKFSFVKTFDAMLPVIRSTAANKPANEIIECDNCGEPSSNKICKVCKLLDKLGIKLTKQSRLVQKKVEKS